MTAMERREAILDVLCQRKHDQIKNLAEEFGVSERTIRTDIEVLSCSYPIETVRGRYGGGVKVADWYHRDRKTLSPEQVALLKRLAPGLKGQDLATLNSIINTFGPCCYLRIWLVQLGMAGVANKESRKALLAGLKGHTAFRTKEEAEKFSIAQKEKRAAVKAAQMAGQESEAV